MNMTSRDFYDSYFIIVAERNSEEKHENGLFICLCLWVQPKVIQQAGTVVSKILDLSEVNPLSLTLGPVEDKLQRTFVEMGTGPELLLKRKKCFMTKTMPYLSFNWSLPFWVSSIMSCPKMLGPFVNWNSSPSMELHSDSWKAWDIVPKNDAKRNTIFEVECLEMT